MIVIVLWMFLMVPSIGMQFVIVVFPDHAHKFFMSTKNNNDARAHTLIPPSSYFFKLENGYIDAVCKV